ncbi:hypothetical protein [Demequina silvatica]|uniref:hypothetical protein n=1 Tax=Demequina silvatica TaxID=1638988 RepID=UPI000782F3AF|nr:hypothetical protein [Demequina silvatica]
MSREERLRAAARAVTGDESVTDVAEFMPQAALDDPIWNGRADSRVARDEAGHLETVAAGAHLGEDLAAHRAALPPHVCLAVTPAQVHVLGLPHGFFGAHLEQAYLMGSFRRDALEVAVTGRLTDIVMRLTDTGSGAQMTLVADRLSAYHPRTVIELLRLTAAHRGGARDVADDPAADQPQD